MNGTLVYSLRAPILSSTFSPVEVSGSDPGPGWGFGLRVQGFGSRAQGCKAGGRRELASSNQAKEKRGCGLYGYNTFGSEGYSFFRGVPGGTRAGLGTSRLLGCSIAGCMVFSLTRSTVRIRPCGLAFQNVGLRHCRHWCSKILGKEDHVGQVRGASLRFGGRDGEAQHAVALRAQAARITMFPTAQSAS